MRIFALCTVQSGSDLLRLIHERLPLSGIIGLTDRSASDEVSGFVHMAPLARLLDVPFIGVEDYSLNKKSDRQRLAGLKPDLLLVCGWQRLIPAWLIDQCRVGAVGIHGSPNGISGGRGRSPQNWAIILGARRFSISLFFIDPGIDSGAVIASRDFPLGDDDTIVSSYVKATMATADMIAQALAEGLFDRGKATPQMGEVYYLPRRLPEDGAIDWNRSAREIARFVAALTRPYPGAFSTWAGARLNVWKARPIDVPRPEGARPGQVLLVCAGGAVIVSTGDGALMIEDWELIPATDAGSVQEGFVLPSADFVSQMRQIVARHRQRYPDLALSPDILSAAKLR